MPTVFSNLLLAVESAVVAVFVIVVVDFLFDLDEPKECCKTACNLPCICESLATIDTWAGSDNCLVCGGESP